jgi:hypothetical protein
MKNFISARSKVQHFQDLHQDCELAIESEHHQDENKVTNKKDV